MSENKDSDDKLMRNDPIIEDVVMSDDNVDESHLINPKPRTKVETAP